MKGAISAASRAARALRAPKLLFVGRPDMHSRVLAQYLSGALYANCHFDHEQQDSQRAIRDSLVLIDCKHHDHDAIAGRLEEMYETEPESRAVLLNASPDSRFDGLIHWPCLKGIFFEDCNHELLLKGMHTVLQGDIWMPRRLLESTFERQRAALPPRSRLKSKLSRRERDILQCIAGADSNAAIADKLHISEHTVKSHIYNIFRKIEVRNRTEASHWAMLNLPVAS